MEIVLRPQKASLHPKPPSSPMGDNRTRSPSPRGRRHHGENERHAGRSKDHRSSTRHNERREDEYDTKHLQPSRDRSRGRNSDEEDRHDRRKKCVTVHLTPRLSTYHPFPGERETNLRSAKLGRRRRGG